MITQQSSAVLCFETSSFEYTRLPSHILQHCYRYGIDKQCSTAYETRIELVPRLKVTDTARRWMQCKDAQLSAALHHTIGCMFHLGHDQCIREAAGVTHGRVYTALRGLILSPCDAIFSCTKIEINRKWCAAALIKLEWRHFQSSSFSHQTLPHVPLTSLLQTYPKISHQLFYVSFFRWMCTLSTAQRA